MYPVLFKIPLFGGVTIYSYGVMVALGFVAAIIWVTLESKRLGQNPSRAMDLVFYLILSGVLGARVLNVLIAERERFFADPLMLIRVWEGGLVFYGGFITALLVAIWYFRHYKMPVFLTVDIFAPAVALGHGIGRIGCFLAGCCFGAEVGHPAWYAVTFPSVPRTFAPTGIPLYPTQLMEVFGEFLIFTILFFVRKIKRFDGQIMAMYLMLYAVLRSFNELFRGDAERGFVVPGWLSTSQFISLLIFIAGALLYFFRRKKGFETEVRP